ncbi:MAG: hypothetical protein AMXMBFR20_32140 [Planctomycetia bacterium]
MTSLMGFVTMEGSRIFTHMRLTAVVWVGAVCLAAGGPAIAAPAIKAESSSQDFGKTFTGLQLRHTFTLRNTGDEDLVISRIDFDAGCYQDGEYPPVIAAGKSIPLKLAVDARKIEGAFVRTATVLSNDPAMPRLTLRMTGNCSAPVELNPPFAGFGKIIDGKERETSVQILNKTGEKFEVSLVGEEDELYSFKLVEVKPGFEYRLDVKTKMPLVQGRLESMALLYTTLEAQPELPVNVFAYVPPRLEVIPTYVMWDAGRVKSPPTGFSSVLLFTNNGDRPVQLKDVTIDDTDIKLTKATLIEGRSYRIKLEAPPKYELPEMGKTVTITTDDNFFPTIRIPVRRAPMEGELPAVDETGKELTIDKLVGRTAPRFNLTTIEGVGIGNRDMRSAITLLNFFAPGDRHNHEQLLKLEGIRRSYGDRGIRIVNVCEKSELTDVTQDRQVEIMQNAEIRGELSFDLGNEVGRSFKLLIYPTLVIVNKAGVIEGFFEGNEDDFVERVTKSLDILLTGRSLADSPDGKTRVEKAKPESVGKTAPDFTLDLGSGRKFKRDDASGYGATVLNFVAVDDSASKAQIPIIEAAAEAYAAKGVKFIHVNQTVGASLSRAECEKAMNVLNVSASYAHDPTNAIGQLFKVESYPTLVVIRRDRTVFGVYPAAADRVESVIPAQIEAAIKSAKYESDR